MTDKTKAFFAEYDLYPKNDLEALEILREKWMFNFVFEASSSSVCLKIPFYGFTTYCDNMKQAMGEAVEYATGTITPEFNLSEEEKQKILQKFAEDVDKGVKYHIDRMNYYLTLLAARL